MIFRIRLRISWIGSILKWIKMLQFVPLFFRNPMGRTGLRGRGLLSKWGPNHLIKAVISRFKAVVNDNNTTNPVNQRQSQLTSMEILVHTSQDGSRTSLIGVSFVFTLNFIYKL